MVVKGMEAKGMEAMMTTTMTIMLIQHHSSGWQARQ